LAKQGVSPAVPGKSQAHWCFKATVYMPRPQKLCGINRSACVAAPFI
jgi:hypothetical protein